MVYAFTHWFIFKLLEELLRLDGGVWPSCETLRAM